MTHKEEMLLREQLHRLLDVALDANGFEERWRDETGVLPTVFFEFAGHVNRLIFDISPNGWDFGESGRVSLIDCKLDKPLPDRVIEDAIATCEAALEDKTELDVLAKDIRDKEEILARKSEELIELKEKLSELRKKERSSTDAVTSAELSNA